MSYSIIEVCKMLTENLPYAVLIEDINNTIVFINKKYEELYDVTFEKVQGKKISEYITSEFYMFPLLNNYDDSINIYLKKDKEFEYLKRENEILRTIIDSLPEPIYFKDKDSKLLECNKAFKDYYKKTGVEKILGKDDLEIYHDKDMAKQFIKIDREVMETKKPKYYEQKVKNYLGQHKIEENAKIPVIDDSNESYGVVGIVRDITEKKKFEERLIYLSQIDILTGLYNRHSFEEKIEVLNNTTNFPLGIIMGDANGLKLINDTLGHLEGDKLLVNIAIIFKEVCGPDSYVFRWGGDEFIILLPNHDEEKCEKVIYEIKKKCESFDHDFIEINIALGEVVKYTVEEDIYTCIRKVEEKVYLKKLLEKKSVKSNMINSLKKSLEEKSIETTEHTNRVTDIAIKIGKKMNLKISELDELVLTCQLHDIGKIGIDEELLKKPEKLSEFEFELMKTHAEKGYRIINAASELGDVAKYVLSHHENWDGSGYPIGLKKEEIPLISRIVSVADAFDVMTHDRPYRKAMTKEEALCELQKCAGKQFDYNIVQHLKDSME